VADRDAAVGARLAGLLREAGVGDAAHCEDQETFLRMLRSQPARWQVALWHEDLEPDARRRLGLLNTWQREFPGTAMVLTTDALTSASTLTALRGGAAEIVPRTAPAAELAAVVRHAHEAHRLRHAPPGHPEPPRMLVVGAHPDDGEIGAGGLIHRRVRDGWEITMLAMSHGSFGGDPDRRAEEARRAAAALGASFRMEDFPDGHITDATETVQAIERTVADVAPDVVLVHSEHDTHQDHRAVHRATLVAARRVPRVACYQSPSATVEFRPNRFIGLREADVEAKLDAIRAHRSQADTRAYLDEDLIRSTARYWGRFTGDAYVEPLEVVRYSAELERSLV
jgi:LmbE family N-acetylglucosaminyl deacetylase